MNQRGRKSPAALAVVPNSLSAEVRLPPPRTLTHAQRQIWLETVNALPVDWFRAQHVPLLQAYCRHLAYADRYAEALNAMREELLLDDEGLKRHDRLSAMHEREMRAASSLATRMRLTQQAVVDKRTAGRKGEAFRLGPKPWEVPES